MVEVQTELNKLLPTVAGPRVQGCRSMFVGHINSSTPG
jgi:hypothetical protein